MTRVTILHPHTTFSEWRMAQFSAALFFITVLLMGAAQAATAVATASVNMRSGPGTKYRVIIVIPAGAPVEVNRCHRRRVWCDVSYGRYRGWVSGRYLDSGRYAYGPGPAVTLGFFLGAPLWYDRWYHGGYYYHGRPPYYGRPPGHRPPGFRPPGFRPPGGGGMRPPRGGGIGRR